MDTTNSTDTTDRASMVGTANMADMAAWGLAGRFAALAAERPTLSCARVISQEKGMYQVVYEHGMRSAVVSGKLRHEALTPSDFPAVGDFVMLSPGEGDGQAVIQDVLPRASVFIRKAAGTGKAEQVVAANIDTVFLCMSLNNDFNLRRMERYLAIAWDSGAMPVVVLTKSDLCDDLASKLAAVEGVALGAGIVATSAVEDDGYQQVLPYISAGKTVAFVGSSGTGKSTLINRLLGTDQLETSGLRNDDKGHHTTTRRELLLLPRGGMVIDTPGMRELGMWDASEGIDAAFADIEALAGHCRFTDCTHTNEPGCAVRAALEIGELDMGRWLSYCKLSTENAYAEDAEGYLAAKEKRFKGIAKQLKGIEKSEKSNHGRR